MNPGSQTLAELMGLPKRSLSEAGSLMRESERILQSNIAELSEENLAKALAMGLKRDAVEVVVPVALERISSKLCLPLVEALLKCSYAFASNPEAVYSLRASVHNALTDLSNREGSVSDSLRWKATMIRILQAWCSLEVQLSTMPPRR